MIFFKLATRSVYCTVEIAVFVPSEWKVNALIVVEFSGRRKHQQYCPPFSWIVIPTILLTANSRVPVDFGKTYLIYHYFCKVLLLCLVNVITPLGHALAVTSFITDKSFSTVKMKTLWINFMSVGDFFKHYLKVTHLKFED